MMDVVVVTNLWTFMLSVRMRYAPRNVTSKSNADIGFLEATHGILILDALE